ncbi:MAG: hypothetical protein PWP46_1634 [Fusobacteriaceae bacterium]|jgi:hypothetical protein|nr:hypothetical protein [Fusobacteriaceae bacterium]
MEIFLSLDWEIGVQFIKKISGADTFDINAAVDSSTASTIVTQIDDGASNLLNPAQETELIALLQSDLFELQAKLDEYGVTPPAGFSLPDSNTVVGDLENQIDTMVNSTGLGFIQDLLGYAPLPFFSFGFTVFLW